MQLVGIARNPVPSGAVQGTFAGRDGLKLRYALWPRTSGLRQGTVCLFTGRGEFIEKYFETVTDLRRRGFAVAMMDWRGQGGSERQLRNPAKSHAEDFADFGDDLRLFMNEIVLPDCPAPFFGMAHGMGAHVLVRQAVMSVCWFDRLVLSSPMIDLVPQIANAPLWRLSLEARILMGLGDFFVAGGRSIPRETAPFSGACLTTDRLRYERVRDVLAASPQLATGSPTLGWLHAAARSIMHINAPAFATSLRVPVLIVAAGNDTIVSTRATENFAMRAKNCRHIVIPGARHDILQERDEIRDQFWAAFDAYVPGTNRTMSGAHLGL